MPSDPFFGSALPRFTRGVELETIAFIIVQNTRAYGVLRVVEGDPLAILDDPEESTVEDIVNTYTESGKPGLKAAAVYRDNSKKVQPLSSWVGHEREEDRRGGRDGYITAGMYDDGAPGELFITMAKEGATISGLMDAFATAASLNRQYGVPLKFPVDKFAHVRFEPSGWIANQQIAYAKSITDYIFRWLGAEFPGPGHAAIEAGESSNLRPTEADPQQEPPFAPVAADAPVCSECGSIRKLLQVRELRGRQRLAATAPPPNARRRAGRPVLASWPGTIRLWQKPGRRS
jgi:hypothetical protein